MTLRVKNLLKYPVRIPVGIEDYQHKGMILFKYRALNPFEITEAFEVVEEVLPHIMGDHRVMVMPE